MSEYCSSVFNSIATPGVMTSIFGAVGWTSYSSGSILSMTPDHSETSKWETMIPPSEYTPPPECCPGCEIVADKVSIMYWPPESDAEDSAVTTAPSTPYSYISNGITL